jgi:hypothetical protein
MNAGVATTNSVRPTAVPADIRVLTFPLDDVRNIEIRLPGLVTTEDFDAIDAFLKFVKPRIAKPKTDGHSDQLECNLPGECSGTSAQSAQRADRC